MTKLIYIIIAIVIFGLLIAIHELGHFLVAKACGVKVLEFSIGMGPQLGHKEGKGDPIFPPPVPHWRILRHGRGGRGE